MDGSSEIRLILVEIFTFSLSFLHSYSYIPTHIHRGTATVIWVGYFSLFSFMIPFLNLFFVVFLKMFYTQRLSILFVKRWGHPSLLTYILLNLAEHFLVNCQGKKTGTQWIDSIYDIAIYWCIWEKVFIVYLTALILPFCKWRFPFL